MCMFYLFKANIPFWTQLYPQSPSHTHSLFPLQSLLRGSQDFFAVSVGFLISSFTSAVWFNSVPGPSFCAGQGAAALHCKAWGA